jgi:hypothetical protein
MMCVVCLIMIDFNFLDFQYVEKNFDELLFKCKWQ